jgi:hypothetical protein
MKRILVLIMCVLAVSTGYAQRDANIAQNINFQAHVDASAIYTYEYFRTGFSIHEFTVAGPAIDLTLGARITKYFYLGAGVGYHTLMRNIDLDKTFAGGTSTSIGKTWFYYNHYLPIYANLKIYRPVSPKFLPYIDTSIGGYIGFPEMLSTSGSKNEYVNLTHDFILSNGFYLRAGLGIDVKRLNIGIGYELLNASRPYYHHGYVKLGWRFG